MVEIKKIINNFWVLEEKPDFAMKKMCSTDTGIVEEEIIESPEKVLALINGYLFRKYKYENFSLISDS